MKKNKTMLLALLALLVVQLAVICWYGQQKTGYHYDEYYSYYSSNISVGLGPFDQVWRTGEELHNEFAVLPGEEYNFARVVQMQSYDVHPPVYYLLLHTLCSLVPGTFSPWIGISLNLFFFVGSWILLALLAWKLSGKKKEAVFLTCLLYGFNPGAVSGVMLVRMYTMLGFWILLITLLHVRAMEQRRRGWRFYLPLAVVIVLGFLTHYYFMVYLFFMAAVMEFYLLLSRAEGKTWKRKLQDCFLYGIVTVGAMLLSVILYPSSAGHIFRGYRGEEAMGAFFDMGNTMDRLRFFWNLLNEYAFGSMLMLVLLILAVLAAVCIIKEKRGGLMLSPADFCEKNRVFLLTALTALGYFAVVAKTALLTAEEANRYQIPVYGILLMLSVALLVILAGKVFRDGKYTAFVSVAAVLLLAGQIMGLCSGKVLFLYQDDAASIEFARENSDAAVVFLYNNNASWMVWDESLELMQYDEIYYVDLSDAEKFLKEEIFAEERLVGADRILVYSMRHDNSQTALDALMTANGKVTDCEMIRELLYCDLYEMTVK